MIPALHTVAEMAESLGVTERKIVAWAKRYNWPHERFGRELRFTDEQVRDILAKHGHRSSATTDAKPLITGQTARSARRAS